MKTMAWGLMATLALSTAAFAQAAAPLWKPQDGFVVAKTLEPVAMKDCKDHTCYPRDGGLAPTMEANSYSTNGVFSDLDTDQNVSLEYVFHGCNADQAGCKSMDINLFLFQDNAPADKVVRWNASKSPCVMKKVAAGAVLTRSIPLTPATTRAQVETLRTKVRSCRTPYATF